MSPTEHRPVLIVIAGPNGSGKTTITSKILRHEWMEDAVYINPDVVAQERFGDWNSSDAVLKAVKYCEALREDCLKQQKSLVFESVLSSDGKVEFIKRAKDLGYFIRVFFVATNHPSINAARIAKRVMQGGHDVPITKIISRYQKSIFNCKCISELVDRLYIYDNSVDGVDARLLFRKAKGKLIKQYSDDIPEWAKLVL
jgi:predicted ABC-type ATPase